MIRRRDALALLGGLVVTACSGARRGMPVVPAGSPLGADPIVDLIPSAGLGWLVDVRPRELFESPTLGSAIAMIAPGDRVAAFERRFGGVDLHAATELAVAGFGRAALGLARVPVDPASVNAAFVSRASVEGRTVEHGVTRLWGTVGDEPEQIAIFGRDGAAIERGPPGPLLAAIYFAEGKLRRSLPALKAEPLAAAAARVGEAPLRGFAPGPFEGQWAAGLGGLLRAATAIAVSLRPMQARPGAAAFLTLVLLGAWGADAPGAEQRLRAAFNVFAEDPLGRLTGLNRPIDGPRTSSDASAIKLDVVVDLVAVAAGLRDATDATAADIMGR
jgi:hypothetical protein